MLTIEKLRAFYRKWFSADGGDLDGHIQVGVRMDGTPVTLDLLAALIRNRYPRQILINGMDLDLPPGVYHSGDTRLGSACSMLRVADLAAGQRGYDTRWEVVPLYLPGKSYWLSEVTDEQRNA